MSVCENCQGDIEDFCTANDPFAGYDGAFKCMASNEGEVAFVRHFTVFQSAQNNTWDPDVSVLLLYGTILYH